MAVTLEDRPAGQVRVETGRGIVAELGPPGGRNRHVKLQATHQRLDELVTGWVDTTDVALARLVERAAAERFEVAYRIEVRRKDGHRPDTPIADVPPRQKIRELVRAAAVTAPAPPPGITYSDAIDRQLASVLAALDRIARQLDEILSIVRPARARRGD